MYYNIGVSTPKRIAKLKRMTTPNVGEVVEHLELLSFIAENVKWHNHFETWSSNFL